MTASHLDQNASSHRPWLGNFFATIDRMDAAGFADHFEPANGSFRFANQAVLQGRELIAQGTSGIFELLDSIRHEILRHWVADGDLIVEGQVHYRRLADGFELIVPFVSVFEFAADSPGPIQSYRVFTDNHELFRVANPR